VERELGVDLAAVVGLGTVYGRLGFDSDVKSLTSDEVGLVLLVSYAKRE
jgi:hypothetical protein